MSDDSTERVSGKAKLERKCRFLLVACLLLVLLIAGSFWWYSIQTENFVIQTKNLVFQQNRIKGRLLVDQSLYMLHWQELETNEEFKLAINNMTEDFRKEAFACDFIKTDGSGKTVKKRFLPRPPETTDTTMKTVEELDQFERDVVERVAKAKSSPRPDVPEYAERFLAGRAEYHYYQPIYADAHVCVACHHALGDVPLGSPASKANSGKGGPARAASLKEGDLMAVVEVTIPNP